MPIQRFLSTSMDPFHEEYIRQTDQRKVCHNREVRQGWLRRCLSRYAPCLCLLCPTLTCTRGRNPNRDRFFDHLAQTVEQANTRFASATAHVGFLCFRSKMPLAVFQVQGWYPILMRPWTKATVRSPPHRHYSLSALKPMPSSPEAFLTECVNSASRTSLEEPLRLRPHAKARALLSFLQTGLTLR